MNSESCRTSARRRLNKTILSALVSTQTARHNRLQERVNFNVSHLCEVHLRRRINHCSSLVCASPPLTVKIRQLTIEGGDRRAHGLLQHRESSFQPTFCAANGCLPRGKHTGTEKRSTFTLDAGASAMLVSNERWRLKRSAW